MHSCEPWISQNISCPEGLIQGARRSEGFGEAPPDDELEEIHEREPVGVPADGFDIEERVLRELAKRMGEEEDREIEVDGFAELRRKTPREKTVEMLKQHVTVPAELVREAVRQGATSPELEKWVAAAALVLGAGAMAAAVPGTIRSVSASLRGMRGGGGVGFRFNDRARIDALLGGAAKKLRLGDGFARTGAGEFFSGTLG